MRTWVCLLLLGAYFRCAGAVTVALTSYDICHLAQGFVYVNELIPSTMTMHMTSQILASTRWLQQTVALLIRCESTLDSGQVYSGERLSDERQVAVMCAVTRGCRTRGGRCRK